MNAIVGVHGARQWVPELTPAETTERLANAWSAALTRGTGQAQRVEMAYYAHHLARDLPPAEDEAARRRLLRWDGALRERDQTPQGPFTAPIRQIISGMAARSLWPEDLVQRFVRHAQTDVDTYFDPDCRDRRLRARDAVADTIRAHRATVVLAHSLGSVLAYEALHAHPDLGVDLLVTLGSPLAVPGLVLDRLEPGRVPPARGPRPPGVRRWVNIADLGDLFAVPRGLDRRFEVDEDIEATAHLFRFHKAATYLASAELARVLGGVPAA